MHSEYGCKREKKQHESFVKGLKTLFPEKVVIFSLDPPPHAAAGKPDVELNTLL